MARFGVQLAKDAEAQISRALVKEINTRIAKIRLAPVERELKKYLVRNIKNTRHYNLLTDNKGVLLRHFGLTEADEKLDNIIEYIVDTVNIRFTRARRSQGNTFLGTSILVEVLKGGVRQLLVLNDALQDRSMDRKGGEPLPWLEWILTAGDSVIITGYDVKLGTFDSPQPSRTGGAIMIQRKDESWGVPAHLAGTVQNNFITEALEGVEEYGRQLMLDALKKAGL